MARKKKIENVLLDKEKQIVKYLKDKGIYEDVDDFLVSQVIENIKQIHDAILDIKARGNLVPISSNGLIGMNPSITIYNKALKNYQDLCRKLCLSPHDRQVLKIEVDVDDGF
ncbi:P27 family phage terminase small subunit [Carboxylicivirga sp. RSCT41]|uniref:P27 family phage terminase small subunit n=1 Tax=Carboxylicivirga agarovorans TaxID=3417570 RepID=UPI003D3481A8